MRNETVRKARGNRLTAMLQVRNEADKHLEAVLQDLTDFVDEIVIVDDASTDGTVKLCRSFAKVSKLIELKQSSFHREWELRLLLWNAACETKPGWLLSVDADEFYEDKAKAWMRTLIDQDEYDWVGFRFFDFWGGTTHYREDRLWQIHRRHTRSLVRYIPGYYYFFPRMDHHVPRLPLTYAALPGFLSELRVKHYGWAVSQEELYRKYLRYMERDPNGEWGSLEQYRSILDENPNLVPWKEEA
ncbi:glycosyl transferase family 2 [Gordoniibacillus kamchatkensis]|uniref:Glycosyl transferase family 2 n=1 Tax=Gordoniibacillus kamchatkensis TaxID=1590651 RepID=A0ABR5AGN8_9BACL|nr:glycosyltransferase [Paenibacillus sp. VKM B-2647]KIL40213.1 glycosyl transferase family 2 [Paenibacillus sp. VKM B-2647]